MRPRTPLLRPDRFFAERDPHALRLLVVGCVLLLSLPVAVSTVGWIVTERVDGTVTVDNPGRPSEAFCRGAPDGMDAGCDAPARVERNVDEPIREALGQFYGPALLAFPIALAFVGGLLHAGSWLLEAENGAGATFVVAAWGLLPSVVGLLGFVALFALLLDPLAVTPDSDPRVLVEHVRTELGPLSRWGPAIGGLTTTPVSTLVSEGLRLPPKVTSSPW